MMAPIRVAFYGCGNFAQKTRIPNVLKAGAQVVGLSDVNARSLQAAAELCPGAQIFEDAHEMLEDYESAAILRDKIKKIN